MEAQVRTSIRETGAAAIWAAEHDIPCEWSKVPEADQEMYLRMFDAAVAAYTLLAAEQSWNMRPDEATRDMRSAGEDGVDKYYDGAKETSFEMSIGHCYRAMLAAAPKFEWDK